MKKMFLSYHFEHAGQTLADMTDELIKSHGIQVVTGRRLAGLSLSDEIGRLIDGCDGLVCLLTEREQDRNDHWVRDERARAAATGKRVIAVVQNGLADGGFYGDREQIRYNPDHPVPTLLALSATIGRWRQDSGRTLVAQISPVEAVRFLMSQRDFAKIRYRCWIGPGYSDWRDGVVAKPVGNGVQLYIPGVRDDEELQLEIVSANEIWESGVVSPAITLSLARRDKQ